MNRSDCYDNDNEISEDFYDDEIDETETAALGSTLVKKRFKRTVDDDTVAAMRLDTDLTVPEVVDDADLTEPPDVELPRNVSPAVAKQHQKARLAEASKDFDFSRLKETPIKTPATRPVASNENGFNETESCPLLEQLNRTTFEPDEKKREKLIGAFQYIRELVDTAGADALGLSVHRPGKEATVDHDLQRSESGKVVYAFGQTLDRKGRVYDQKNGEIGAKRFDGPVRTAKKSPGSISNGFDVNLDDAFVQRKIDAQIELEDLAAVVGPLWLPLLDAVCSNFSFTGIAAGMGYKQPVVGSAFVKLALEVVTSAIEAKHTATDFRQYVRNHRLPVAARRYERALKDAQCCPIAA